MRLCRYLVAILDLCKLRGFPTEVEVQIFKGCLYTPLQTYWWRNCLVMIYFPLLLTSIETPHWKINCYYRSSFYSNSFYGHCECRNTVFAKNLLVQKLLHRNLILRQDYLHFCLGYIVKDIDILLTLQQHTNNNIKNNLIITYKTHRKYACWKSREMFECY